MPERHTSCAQTEPLTQGNVGMDAVLLDMFSKLEANELEMVADGASLL